MFKYIRKTAILVCIAIVTAAVFIDYISNATTQTSDIVKITATLIGGLLATLQVVAFVLDRYFPELDKRKQRTPLQQIVGDVARSHQLEYLRGRSWEIKGERFWKSEWYVPLQTELISNHDPDILEDKRFVILGNPGAGKSTLLRKYMSEVADQYRSNPDSSKTAFPLWIDLGLSENPADAEDLILFWLNRHSLPANFESMIANERLILFLDGLNEMPEIVRKREERAESLKEFIHAYPNLPVVVTCRTVDYEVGKLDLDLPKVHIKPPSDNLRKQLILRRVENDELWNTLEDNQNLSELSESPRNLSIIIRLFTKPKDLPTSINDLPASINDLFDHYVRLLFDEYKQDIRPLSNTERADLTLSLQKLAFKMIDTNQGTTTTRKWIRRKIGRKSLRLAIEIGLLQDRDGLIEFDHQSLQSYFALPEFLNALKPNRRKSVIGCVGITVYLIIFLPLTILYILPVSAYLILTYINKRVPHTLSNYTQLILGNRIFSLLLGKYFFLGTLIVNYYMSYGIITKLAALGENAKPAIPLLEELLINGSTAYRIHSFSTLFLLRFPDITAFELLKQGLLDDVLFEQAINLIEHFFDDLEYYFGHRPIEFVPSLLDLLGNHRSEVREFSQRFITPLVNVKNDPILRKIFVYSDISIDYFDIKLANLLIRIGEDSLPHIWNIFSGSFAEENETQVSLSIFVLTKFLDRDGLESLTLTFLNQERLAELVNMLIEVIETKKGNLAWPIALFFAHLVEDKEAEVAHLFTDEKIVKKLQNLLEREINEDIKNKIESLSIALMMLVGALGNNPLMDTIFEQLREAENITEENLNALSIYWGDLAEKLS